MTNDASDNKAIVREYLKSFNDRDRDAMGELLAADAIEHGVHGEIHGREAIVDFLAGHFEAFPDYSGTTEQLIAEGDHVTVRYTARGTHTGEYRDVEPTGETAEWSGIAIYRIEDGQITEIWLEEDRLGLLEQLKLVDSPPAAHLRL
jgi:steroid delta-isomerase-like uncharacterized protein